VGERLQIHRETAERAEAEVIEPIPDSSAAERADDLKKDLDDLLDTIDEVLEENPEEFVAQFRQRGGE